jgi:hypothetical protein
VIVFLWIVKMECFVQINALPGRERDMREWLIDWETEFQDDL